MLLGGAFQSDREPEGGSLVRDAVDFDSSHQMGKLFDDGESEAGTPRSAWWSNHLPGKCLNSRALAASDMPTPVSRIEHFSVT